MEKWKLITAAASVGLSVVGGVAVNNVAMATDASDRVATSSAGMSAYATEMAAYCANTAVRTGGTSIAVTGPVADCTRANITH